jgi:hypothetical protein
MPQRYSHAQSVAGGHRAHRILDYAIDPKWEEGGVLYGGAVVWVETPRAGWHAATLRERAILRTRFHLAIWVDPNIKPKRRRPCAK